MQVFCMRTDVESLKDSLNCQKKKKKQKKQYKLKLRQNETRAV